MIIIAYIFFGGIAFLGYEKAESSVNYKNGHKAFNSGLIVVIIFQIIYWIN
jgi:hypothetical protein